MPVWIRAIVIVPCLILCLEFSAPAWAAMVLQDEDLPDAARHRIPMEPLFFNLIDRGRVRGRVQLELVLEIVEDTDFEDVKKRLPQIRSDFLTALSTLARDRFRYDQPINPDLVIAFLQPVADRRLGQEVVNVYVFQALVNPA